MVSIGLEIADSDRKIESKILKVFAKEIRNKIKKAANQSLDPIKKILRQAVYLQPEYDSLLHGDLQAELGIVDPGTKLEQIIAKWLDNLTTDVTIRISQKSLKGTFTVKLLNNNYADLLPIGTYNSINAAGVLTEIPWLRWLLLDGNVTIVGYRFGTKPDRVMQRYSRTKRGLMFRQLSGRWTMPARFVGTANDNFLTRAVQSVQIEIKKVLEQELVKVFK